MQYSRIHPYCTHNSKSSNCTDEVVDSTTHPVVNKPDELTEIQLLVFAHSLLTYTQFINTLAKRKRLVLARGTSRRAKHT